MQLFCLWCPLYLHLWLPLYRHHCLCSSSLSGLCICLFVAGCPSCRIAFPRTFHLSVIACSCSCCYFPCMLLCGRLAHFRVLLTAFFCVFFTLVVHCLWVGGMSCCIVPLVQHVCTVLSCLLPHFLRCVPRPWCCNFFLSFSLHCPFLP